MKVVCPKCNSEQLSANQKGFSAGKAVGGALLTGGVGLLAGYLGSKDVVVTCLVCGNSFKAGDGKVLDDNGNIVKLNKRQYSKGELKLAKVILKVIGIVFIVFLVIFIISFFLPDH